MNQGSWLAWSLACGAMVVLAAFSGPAGAVEDEKVRVIILFKEKTDTSLIEKNGGEVQFSFDLVPGVVAEMTRSDMKELMKSDKVKSVEEDAEAAACKDDEADGKGKPSPPPADQVLDWGVDRTGADEVWGSEDATLGNGIKVAVLDTGIDIDHPDLVVAGGVNFVRSGKGVDPSKYDDDNGHGTHCAGIIAAQHDAIGTKGMAPKVQLHAVKVLNKLGNGWYSDIIRGLDWCKANGMNVASLSLTGTVDDPSLHAACDAASSAGIVLVGAAGNAGSSAPEYPAAYSSVVAVSATDKSDSLASFSNFGAHVDLAAPGVNIYSAYKGGTYKTMSGTSMACPHVAGAAALVWGGHLALTASEIIAELTSHAVDLLPTGKDTSFGYGLVDAHAAYDGA